MSKLMEQDPLSEADAILLEEFYGEHRRPRPEAEAPAKAKPSHYKIVCISLYNRDIEQLENMVAELKRRGHSKANKSALIRYALDSVDISKMPRGY